MEEWTNCFVVRISGHSAQFAQRRTIPNAILQKPLYSTFSTVIFRYVLKHLIHLHLSEMNIQCDKFQITLRFTKQSVMLLVALTSCQQLSKWISVCFQTNDDLFWLQIGVCGDVTSHSLVPTVFIEVFMHAGKFHRKSLPFFLCVMRINIHTVFKEYSQCFSNALCAAKFLTIGFWNWLSGYLMPIILNIHCFGELLIWGKVIFRHIKLQ